MDGYCLSDGTPKPSLKDSKNVLSPCYIYEKDNKIVVMNTNDFRSLEYVKVEWEICEDYNVIKKGDYYEKKFKKEYFNFACNTVCT